MSPRPDRPAPPTLRAFAAAARHQSFREAAAALGVTPSAISHQVKALEAFVGAPLFERGVRHVRLTAAGKALGNALNKAFDDIDAALDVARIDSAPKTLKIATLPLFANVWMAPRLHRFEADHPALSLNIHTDARVYDVQAGEADIAIRNVAAPTPGLFARKLIDLRATPLCAPALAAQMSHPKDLAHTTLIGLSVGRAGWPEWLAGAGLPALKPQRTITVDSVPEAISAAVHGRGVMLGLTPLIWDAPGVDGLVAPFSEPPQEAGAYFIVCRKEARANPVVRAFIAWLLAEMRADSRRLRRIEQDRLHAGRG